jgi:diguanylate cyclase (GGDEF)-like protein
MFRVLLRRYGIVTITLGMTLISVLLSVVITWTVNQLMGGGSLGEGLFIAILAPLVIAPLMSAQMLTLLHRLDAAEQQLQLLSHTDELTQTHNRRYFMQYAEQEFKRSERSNEKFSVAIVDLDNFKQINDKLGHLVGDHVLREVSRIFKENLRDADVFARYGGDEFIILLPQTHLEQIQVWAARIFEKIAEKPIRIDGLTAQPHYSMGIAVFEPKLRALDDLLKQADEALYQAKRQGVISSYATQTT